MTTFFLRPLGRIGATAAVGLLLATPAIAAERDAEAAKAAAQGHSPDMQEPKRPAKLPDLTKGDRIPVPKKGGPVTWNMGPTGIIGIKNGGYSGDQVRVVSVLSGSPAEGLVKPGDVILGVGGKDFVAGGHLGVQTGNAIIEAEARPGGGTLKIHLWRDRNWLKRDAPKDVFGVDIDQMIEEAEEDPGVYEWQDEEERTTAVKKMAFDEFPIDGVHLNVDVPLRFMGTYSDTSPWDCPVIEKIRGEALAYLAQRFRTTSGRGRSGGDWPGVLALVASGEPEYVELAKQWVHRQEDLCRDMEAEPNVEDMPYKGMQTWRHGFTALELAIYHDATGDDYVLPELRYRAILTAKGQNGGGSWGHTFAFPSFNGGQLHGRNPGYGAMNNSGTRCFFLLTLARKAGIEHPEIEAAIARSARFFGTYIDKGCIPYGCHPPAPSDDSNGKNYGATYAFYTLGDLHAAKFLATHSANAAFSRRGGHGSPNLWYYTPLSAMLAGPRAVQASMRNLRWFYTLSRRHNGSFVFLGEQSPGIGGRGMRSPTATHALFFSAPLKQLVITGKGVEKSSHLTDEEYEELLVSARPQITDPTLLEQAGKPWQQRGTDEIIGWLDHFYPKVRKAFAKELGKRYQAGEKAIPAKVVPLLTSDEARAREGACLALAACGEDAVLGALSKIVALLDDPAEFVRMTAVTTMANATGAEAPDQQRLLLRAAAYDYPGITLGQGNVRTAVKRLLFSAMKGSPLAALAHKPFDAELDETLLRTALAKLITLDPGGTVPGSWDRDTLVRLAGPVAYVAEEMQINDTMFGYGRTDSARKLLAKHRVRELIESDLVNTRKHCRLDRRLSRNVTFAHRRHRPYATYLNGVYATKYAFAYRSALPMLYRVLQDRPLETVFTGWETPNVDLDDIIATIENAKPTAPLPSLADDAKALFRRELAACADAEARTRLCRDELKDPDSTCHFRMIAAITDLVKMLGPAEAVNDLKPYFGHSYWRLRDHAHAVGVAIARDGGAEALLAAMRDSNGDTAAALLAILAEADVKAALEPARQALANGDPKARRGAIQAVVALAGNSGIDEAFAFLQQTEHPLDLEGCEKALLSRRDDDAFAAKVRAGAIARLPQATIPRRRSLAWVLGQLGGPDALAALEQAATATEDGGDLREIVMALAYSPDRAAEQTMLSVAKAGNPQRDTVVGLSVHRMVGPNGPRDVTDAQRVRFARAILDMKLNSSIITYLGRVHTGPAVQLLLETMKQGGSLTATAANGIISAADGMKTPTQKDREQAVDGLRNVIEYLEVNYLRGGPTAHMKKEDRYSMWKAMQVRAGKVMLRLHKPKAAPIPTFDDMDLDL